MNKRAESELTNAAGLEQSAFWMPYTANRQFKKSPRLLARAEGMHYWTADGRQVLDGCAGLSSADTGRSPPTRPGAARKRGGEMVFAPTFQMGPPIAFEFAGGGGRATPAG